MDFERNSTERWHREVPGARWFKADLHIHTVDDIAGKQAKMPADVSGRPEDPTVQTEYGRRLLQAAVSKGVQVLGLTPHSPRGVEGTSAVWRIVEIWNDDIDDDGVPFREKIYAVFPGFEPSFEQGRRGMHLIFLFDPEIGRNTYLRFFDQVMKGVTPWLGRELQLSGYDAEEALRSSDEFATRESRDSKTGVKAWDYIVLAPHVDGEKGLLYEQKSQIFDRFPLEKLAGLELCDNDLPEDSLSKTPQLGSAVELHRLAFFHASDSYRVEHIGNRHTWFKMARPRIEALRQAFIANDSRIRIGHERAENGGLREITDKPDVTLNSRPWLKSLNVSNGASFFGTGNSVEDGNSFEFSPDLTCVIGGSMTGKSTLLDGLRLYASARMPTDATLSRQVEERANVQFLAGSPRVEAECPGQDPTAPLPERWPAVFYTQSELQSLARETRAVEEMLAKLAVHDTSEIGDRENRISVLDAALVAIAEDFASAEEELADAEQKLTRSMSAKQQIDAYDKAGINRLLNASRELNRWRETSRSARRHSEDLAAVAASISAIDLPDITPELLEAVDGAQSVNVRDIWSNWSRTSDALKEGQTQFSSLRTAVDTVVQALRHYENKVKIEVDRELASRGLDGSQINELQALNQHAAMASIHQTNRDGILKRRDEIERRYIGKLSERTRLIELQRESYAQVIEAIHTQSCERIKVLRIDGGDRQPLDQFIRNLAQSGITRWWNEGGRDEVVSPDELIEMLQKGTHSELDMSDAVAATFKRMLDPKTQRELQIIRCRDVYKLHQLLDDGNYRELDNLSGGQRVSLLLTLLLETNDTNPLVIDQPEDELDNRFVFEEVLPALKRLKGRRQVILATHSANFVVNGDADQVILLEASDNRGKVSMSGAIEEPDVRDAIIRTVDGGDEAFRLRQIKYGF